MISLFHLGSSSGDRNPSESTRRTYLDTYDEINRRSIFIGNLPTEISELEIKDIFSKYGDIVKISTHKNESTIDREYFNTLIILMYFSLKLFSII